MDMNLQGRINNITLPSYKFLLPLLEAVVNSIHSIEDSGVINGYIDISILREGGQTGFVDNGNLAQINGFSILDNGVGFNSHNFNSFSTSDSLYKRSRGSKGVGRFLWLKAFTTVFIESVFKENNNVYKRKVEFSFFANGVKEVSKELLNHPGSDQELYTKVELNNFLNPYRNHCFQKCETIGRQVLEHCISYFVLGQAPKVRVIDGREEFDVNAYFSKNLEVSSDNDLVDIKGHRFSIRGIKYYNSTDSNHKLFYCANNRTVTSEQLHKYIPNLVETRKLRDSSDKLFTYLAFVSSDFLDQNVNQERTGFNLIEYHDGFTEELGFLSLEEVQKELTSLISNNLSLFLESVKENKLRAIHDYVVNEAVEYRPLLKYSAAQLDSIKPGLSPEKLDLELHKIMSNYECGLKEMGHKLLKTPLDQFEQFPEYREEYHKFLEQYNNLGLSQLGKYVVHRRIIVSLFEKNLKVDSDGRYSLEKDIHEIVFPMRTSSDEASVFEKQNLWLIDERLSYHEYLSSDQPLKKLENWNLESTARPDLLVFNNPIAFVPDEDQPYSSVVVIEFKRPMRDGYSPADDPIAQVYSYIRQIRSGKYTNKDGRLISLREDTPFYAYIICDLTSDIQDFAVNSSLIPTPDLQGYFGFNSVLKTYIEVLSFNKLIRDAKQRNRILFKKLGI